MGSFLPSTERFTRILFTRSPGERMRRQGPSTLVVRGPHHEIWATCHDGTFRCVHSCMAVVSRLG